MAREIWAAQTSQLREPVSPKGVAGKKTNKQTNKQTNKKIHTNRNKAKAKLYLHSPDPTHIET
jgi:hypothetical protein